MTNTHLRAPRRNLSSSVSTLKWNFEDELGKKNCPRQKNHCSHSPRPHTMDAVFRQRSQGSSVRAAGPTMPDICITSAGSQPTVKMVPVNE